jgi:hypothetical protein
MTVEKTFVFLFLSLFSFFPLPFSSPWIYLKALGPLSFNGAGIIFADTRMPHT